MSLRAKIALYIGAFLILAGSLIFVLGPVLFASIAYPLPDKYRPSVAKWTDEYCKGVASPNFLSALIFTESGWHESARSYAGAVGMTQFIPSTARAVAERLGVSPFQPEDLIKNYDLSIRFGAYYICGRIRDYGGNIRKGLIAYNGGGGAVLAYERGAPIISTVGYADKIISIEKVYDKIYGSWWKSLSASGDNSDFELKPKTDFSILVTVPILDFWRGLLSPPAKDIQDDGEINNSAGGGLNSLWKIFVPGS